jgi:putative PIN family toxin of toxin-antitoxin system
VRCGGGALRVVVDTDIWVSGLIASGSRPRRVIDAVRTGRVTAVARWELAEEIAEVLTRPALARRYAIDETDRNEILSLLQPLLPKVEIAVTLRDPTDAPVVASALTGGAEAIVTGDRDLLDDAPLREWLSDRGVRVLTAADLLELLRP